MNVMQEKSFEIDNLPNRLTILRMILIPVVVGLLYGAVESEAQYKNLLGWLAALIFALASLTDFLDGHIARKNNLVTVFGSFLDPIADKFLTVSSLIMLQALGRVPAFLVIILVLREMYMTSLRLLAVNEGVNVAVSNLGKWKTAVQMIGIPLLMAHQNLGPISLAQIGTWCLYLAVVLSLWSAVSYSLGMIAKLKALRLKRKKKKGISRE